MVSGSKKKAVQQISSLSFIFHYNRFLEDITQGETMQHYNSNVKIDTKLNTTTNIPMHSGNNRQSPIGEINETMIIQSYNEKRCTVKLFF